MVPLDSDRISPVPPYSGYWLGIKRISPTGLSPSIVWLSSHVLLHVLSPYHQSYNPPQDAVTSWVWAISRSLATTWEITLVFFSSAYLDVSVQRVRLPPRMCGGGYPDFIRMGCPPIRKSPDYSLFAATRSLSQLITSFVASESLGILHTPLITFFVL